MGAIVGVVGAAVGTPVGAIVGAAVGPAEGAAVGTPVSVNCGKLWLSGGEDAGPWVSKEAPERAMLMDMRRALGYFLFLGARCRLVSHAASSRKLLYSCKQICRRHSSVITPLSPEPPECLARLEQQALATLPRRCEPSDQQKL